MSESTGWGWSQIAVEVGLKVGLVAALAALSFWLWPERVFEAGRATSIGDWFVAGLSVWVGILALLSSYFLAAEPLLALVQRPEKTIAEGDEMHIDPVRTPLNR